jgi:fused signal recognition particle receptor
LGPSGVICGDLISLKTVVAYGQIVGNIDVDILWLLDNATVLGNVRCRVMHSTNPSQVNGHTDVYGEEAVKAREAARAAAEEAEREAARVAAEEAEREAARVAAEEAEREAARVAAEEAEREAARVAAEEAEREAARVAAEEAEREAARVAAEEAEREAARVAAEEAEREAVRAAAEEAEREAARVAAEEAEREAARVAAEEAEREAARGEGSFYGVDRRLAVATTEGIDVAKLHALAALDREAEELRREEAARDALEKKKEEKRREVERMRALLAKKEQVSSNTLPTGSGSGAASPGEFAPQQPQEVITSTRSVRTIRSSNSRVSDAGEGAGDAVTKAPTRPNRRVGMATTQGEGIDRSKLLEVEAHAAEEQAAQERRREEAMQAARDKKKEEKLIRVEQMKRLLEKNEHK